LELALALLLRALLFRFRLLAQALRLLGGLAFLLLFEPALTLRFLLLLFYLGKALLFRFPRLLLLLAFLLELREALFLGLALLFRLGCPLFGLGLLARDLLFPAP